MQVISKIVDQELTLNRTLFQMPFQRNNKPLTATFAECHFK